MATVAKNIPRVVPLARDGEVADAELVSRARDGDRWAEDVLVRRHDATIVELATRLLGSRHEADDVTQDTFAAALQELRALRDPSTLRAWLVQIAVRKVHRRFRKWKLLRLLGIAPGDSDAGLARHASSDLTPEQRAELVLLDRALARVPDAERLAWMLRFVEGMQLDEVAAAVGCSLATAKRRIAAADSIVRAHVQLEPQEDR